MLLPVQHKAKTVLLDGVRSVIACVGVRLRKSGARRNPQGNDCSQRVIRRRYLYHFREMLHVMYGALRLSIVNRCCEVVPPPSCLHKYSTHAVSQPVVAKCTRCLGRCLFCPSTCRHMLATVSNTLLSMASRLALGVHLEHAAVDGQSPGAGSDVSQVLNEGDLLQSSARCLISEGRGRNVVLVFLHVGHGHHCTACSCRHFHKSAEATHRYRISRRACCQAQRASCLARRTMLMPVRIRLASSVRW